MADIKNQEVEVLRNLLKKYNLGVDPRSGIVKPTVKHTDKKGFESINFEQFPDPVKNLLNFWMTGCHTSSTKFENRKQLFKDVDLMFYNNALMYRAVDMLSDDVIQAGGGIAAINVDAAPKLKEFILEFFDKVQIERLLKPTSVDIIKYGNAGWILSSGPNGIEDIYPISVPTDFIDRIEFTPFEVRKQINDTRSSLYQLSQHEKMRLMIDSIINKNNYSAYFKHYLFGFQIGDYVLPPWRFLHFRNYTNEAPFAPFGIPMFIHSIAPYRQYDMALTLQIAARGAKFPLYKYKLTLPHLFDPSSKLEKGIEFLSELDNSGLYSVQKEGIGVGEKVVTIEGLFDVEEETPNIDLGRLEDIELLRDDIIISTGLPRNFLDPNNGSFGNSGISLKQQYVPYRRKVYNIQSILLENITQLVKIHCIMSNQWKEDEIDFVLSMPFPEENTDRELLGAQKDQLDLANDVLSSIALKLVGDENAPMPPELVQLVYGQMLPFPKDRIDAWIQAALVNRNIKAPTSSSESDSIFGGNEENTPEEEAEVKEESTKRKKQYKEIKTVVNRLGRESLKETINIAFFEKLQNKYRNISLGDKHYFSSKNNYVEFPAETILRLKEEKIKQLLNESEDETPIDNDILLENSFSKNDFNIDVFLEKDSNLDKKPSGAEEEGLT
jgi:hypothetical protein